MLTLTACDFFLNGEELKKELDQQIAYTNAPSVSVYLKADAELGEFLSDGEKTFKVGYDTEVQFTVNQDSYVFEKLEAVVRNSPETSRSESVQFTEVESDAKKGIYKINVKVLEQVSDIMIRPVCTLLPKIASIAPALESSGCDQDTLVSVTFNKPVDTESFFDSDGRLTSLTISSDGEILDDYFDTPYFSEDKKTLYLSPLCAADPDKLLLDLYDTRSFRDITVSLVLNGEKDCDGIVLTENRDHRYRINKNFGNQKKVQLGISGDTSTGSFLEQGKVECTVGFYVEVQYTVNKDDYYLVGLEAVSSSDGSSRSDAVAIKLTAKNEDEGIYKYRIRVTEEVNDILIKAVCLPYPAVDSYLPSSSEAVYSNIPITVTFNMPIDERFFRYEKDLVSLTDNGTDVASLFDSPLIDETKTLLTLRPSERKLYDYILSKNTAYIDLEVSLGEKITVNKTYGAKDYTLSLKQNEKSSFTVRYEPKIESVKPQKFDFFATGAELSLDSTGAVTSLAAAKKFTQEKIAEQGTFSDDEYKAKILQNRTNGTIYIYGRYYDADSGVNAVKITHERTNSKDGVAVSENTVTATLYTKASDNARFFTKDGYTSFCIKYEIPDDQEKSDLGDGAILVTVSVLDAAGNPSEAESFTVIKDSYVDLSDAIVWNIPEPDEHDDDSSKDTWKNDYDDTNRSWRFLNTDAFCDFFEINSKYLKFKLNANSLPVYRGAKIKTCSAQSVYLEYESKTGVTKQKMEWNEEKTWWGTDLNVDKLDNLDFTIYVQDEFGNEGSRKYKIPATVENYIGWTQWGYKYKAIPNNCKVYYGSRSGLSYIGVIDDKDIYVNGTYHFFITGMDIENRLVGDVIKLSGNNLIGTSNYTNFDGFSDIEIKDNVLILHLTDAAWENYSNVSFEVTYKWYIDANKKMVSLIDPSAVISWIVSKTVGQNVSSEQEKKDISFDFGLDIPTYFYEIQLVLIGTSEDLEDPAKLEKTYNIKSNPADDTYPPNLQCTDILRTTKMNELYGIDEDWSEDYVVVTAKDLYRVKDSVSDNFYSSGLRSFELYVNDEKTAVFKPEELRQLSANTYLLPLYGRFVADQKAQFKIIAYDNNNNSAIHEKSVGADYDENFAKILDVTYLNGICKFRFRHVDNDYDRCKLYLFKWKDNHWNFEDSIVPVNGSANVSTEKLPFNIIILSPECYYKLVPEYTSYNWWYFKSPYILSTSTRNSGNYDLIIPNGSSKSSVAVSSDQPVFVQTIVTVKDYDTCKSWDAVKWEANFPKHVGDTVLDFSPSAHSPKRYEIPLDLIHEGECYVVIAHFADGSTAMSEVMQK